MKRFAILAIVAVTACESQSGYDPARYATKASSTPDPETEPLPPAPRRFMMDPRSLPPDAGPDAR